jgi:hypothetical protein
MEFESSTSEHTEVPNDYQVDMISTLQNIKVLLPEYENELNDMKVLQEVITIKYPKLSFIIVFIIPDQEITRYYKNINNKIFIFCLNDKSCNNSNLGNEYKDIFKFISENNLFEITPPSNQNIQIPKPTSRLCFVENIPAVNYFGNFRA